MRRQPDISIDDALWLLSVRPRRGVAFFICLAVIYLVFCVSFCSLYILLFC